MAQQIARNKFIIHSFREYSKCMFREYCGIPENSLFQLRPLSDKWLSDEENYYFMFESYDAYLFDYFR